MIFYMFDITGRGQEITYSTPFVAVPTTPIPILRPANLNIGVPTGFQLITEVTFGGFHNGTPIWKLAKGVSLITSDLVIHKQMAELEGHKIKLIIQPIN